MESIRPDLPARLCQRSRPLDERDEVYQFIHLTFQEFLCAVYLVDSVREIDAIAELLCQAGRIADSWWRETILLAVGYQGLRSTDAPLALIAALIERSAQTEDALAALEVSAAAFLEQNGADPATRTLLTERLMAHLTDPKDRNPPVLRAAAGRALGLLGDPRPGVGVVRARYIVPVPDIDWIAIPAGPFEMGSDKSVDSMARNNETPQFTCHLITKPYRIARYPVTVAQYSTFVQAGGYAEKNWWTNAGWAWRWEWRKKGEITGPKQYREVIQTPNHPVVGISWYEAVAFCAWLSEQMGYQVELPSEAQWERAARHTDARVYPWNGDFAPDRCNMSETGIGATSAVGIFPGGHAECGAADMSGNVFERCRTRWQENYEGYAKKVSDDLTGGELRVLRGEAWARGSAGVRAAYRNRFGPDFRPRNVGFRLVAPGF